jgi:hypothetical protein
VYYRVPVPAESQVPVRFWQGGLIPCPPIPPVDRPVTTGRLFDLSVGGMRVMIARTDDPRLALNDVVGVEFRPELRQPNFVLEACFRHVDSVGAAKLSLGFQFIGLEVSSDGPAILTRLAQAVTRLQHANVLES